MRTKITLACTECKQRNYNTTEFNKITWPDKTETVKESVAVLCVSVVLGLAITLLDTVILYGIDFLTSIGM